MLGDPRHYPPPKLVCPHTTEESGRTSGPKYFPVSHSRSMTSGNCSTSGFSVCSWIGRRYMQRSANDVAAILRGADGLALWNARTLACAWARAAASSQELSPAPYPFHLTSYFLLFVFPLWARMASISYSSSPSMTSGGGLEKAGA